MSATHSPVEAEDVRVGFLCAVECKQLNYDRVETKTNLGRKDPMTRSVMNTNLIVIHHQIYETPPN